MENAIFETDLEYFEKGQPKYKKIEIAFFSQSVERDYKKIMRGIEDFKRLHDEEARLLNDNGLLLSEYRQIFLKQSETGRAKELKKEIKEKEAKREKLLKKLEAFENFDLIDMRLDLIMKIIDQNDITDPDIKTREFWDEKVNGAEITRFLLGVMTKDLTNLGGPKGSSEKK